MARKGSQSKSGPNRASPNRQNTTNGDILNTPERDPVRGEDPSSHLQGKSNGSGGNTGQKTKSNKKNNKSNGTSWGKSDDIASHKQQPEDISTDMQNSEEHGPPFSSTKPRRDGKKSSRRGCGKNSSVEQTPLRILTEQVKEKTRHVTSMAASFFRASMMYVMEQSKVLVEKNRPAITAFMAMAEKGRAYGLGKMEYVYPIARAWMFSAGKLMLLLLTVWLDCNIRGFDSLLRLGTNSLIAVLWCSMLSIFAMIGIKKMLMFMVIAASVVAFIGIGFAVLLVAVLAVVILWLYGSFWTTSSYSPCAWGFLLPLQASLPSSAPHSHSHSPPPRAPAPAPTPTPSSASAARRPARGPPLHRPRPRGRALAAVPLCDLGLLACLCSVVCSCPAAGGMFYSKTMLSKKGPLGAVWVAGVCGVAALTRDQVLRTDVASSVDKILPDVETTYRILGLLLLGVVRIYSKKVEYLCNDSNQFFESTRRVKKVLKRGKKGVCARRLVLDQEDTRGAKRVAVVQVPEADELADLPPIFTIPKRFELDSFDLQIAEDREDDNDDHHQLPHQETLLEDEHHRMPNLYEFYPRMPYADLDSAYVVPVCIIPNEMISVTDEVTDLLYSSNIEDELENDNQNAGPACFTPVKDILPPEAMDMMAEVSGLPEKSKEVKKARREVNGEENGDPACSTPLPESQEMQRPVNAVENVVCADLDENHPVVEESENGLAVEKPNTTASVEIPDIEEQESLEPSTPEPLREGVSGLLEKFMVATPAQNEKRQVTRKRRGLYNKRKVWVLWDENVLLDNDTMREMVDGVGLEDLVGKRRKAPHTRHQIWRELRFRSLPDTFMEPIIQYSTTVRSNSTTADASCGESVKAKKCLSYKPAESNNPHKEAANEETECVPDELLTNGIQTPVGCYNQSQQSQDACGCNDDTPYEKNNTLVNGDEPGLPEERLYESTSHSALRNESLTADIDADIPMDEEHATRDEDFPLSTRTRAVAKCLHQLFLDQKCQQQSDVPVTLGQALEGSKRKTTARFFYETLILKSRGLIDVNQEKPYENITISATPQLDAVLQNPVPPSTS